VLILALARAPAQKGKDDPERKLTDEERMELIRGLTAEYVTVKTFVPRSSKALEFHSDGTWDKADWKERGIDLGPVARTGEKVKITKVDVESSKIVFEINGGFKPRGKWYERIQGGAGTSTRTTPITKDPSISYGTTVALVFPGKTPALPAIEVKKILAPIFEFESHSATQSYFDSLPPEIQEAIKAKRAEVGMTKEQVRMALGQPRDRIREMNDGLETEDWIYGYPPGKITFVTFANSKVIKVKDSYAGLGGQTGPPLKPPQ
jgi:hypothetical protein